MRAETKVVLVAAFLGLLSWVSEALSDYYTFRHGQGSLLSLLAGASPGEIYVRLSVLVVFLGLGVLAAGALRRHRRAEESLRRSEEKYRELVQNANSIIIRWNRDGVLTFFNEFARSFFGYSEDEVIGRSVIGTIVPETESSGRDLTAMMMDICNNPQNYETNVNENTLKSGRRVWIAWTNTPVLDEQQNLTEVLSVGVDLTQQRLAAEALKASEALLKHFVEHTPAAVAMFDTEVRYLLYSRRWMTDYKLGDRDITGLSHYEVFPDIPDRWKQVHQRVLAGAVERCEEDPFVRADGNVVWVRWEVRPWCTEADEISGIIMFTEVITERKRTELALQESEEKYRNLVETTDTGYLIMDSAGCVIDANAEYVRLTGHSDVEQILGGSVLDWTAPYDRARSAEEIRACAKSGSIRGLEVDYAAPGDGITPIEINATMLDTCGEPRVLVLCRDISERRAAEAERRALEQQMEEHNRRFYRETILSVTDGRLEICGRDGVGPYLAGARHAFGVADAAAASQARHEVKEFCRDAGLSGEQTDHLIVGVGEAITNAIKHAVSAWVYVGQGNGTVWVAVSDRGKGIDSLILPRAVLMRGFSTKPSLGLGYCVMLEVADRVLLNTGEQGTTVVLVKGIEEPEPSMSLDMIPDTWDEVTG